MAGVDGVPPTAMPELSTTVTGALAPASDGAGVDGGADAEGFVAGAAGAAGGVAAGAAGAAVCTGAAALPSGAVGVTAADGAGAEGALGC